MDYNVLQSVLVMAEWTLSVVGVATVCVLCEILLAEGTTKKFVKIACGIVVSFVLLSPLVGIVNGRLTTVTSSSANVTAAQAGYLNYVENRKIQNFLDMLVNDANAQGYCVTDAVYKADSVYIYLSEISSSIGQLQNYCAKCLQKSDILALRDAPVIIEEV